ncbi:MAG TPA: fibronectin type III-like domain-contianing protein [Terracidiphilus sp.]
MSSHEVHAGDTLKVEADVTNAGGVAGDEVVEVYLTPPHSAVSPRLALAGFERVHAGPGETQHVSFTVDPRGLSQVDEGGARAVRAGKYRISIGGSQPSGDTSAGVITQEFTIEGTQELPR